MAFFGSDSSASGGGWVEELPGRSTRRARTPPTNSWRDMYQLLYGRDVYGNPIDGSVTMPIIHGDEFQEKIEDPGVSTGGRYPQNQDTKVTPSRRAYSNQESPINGSAKDPLFTRTYTVLGPGDSYYPELADPRRDVKGKSVLHNRGVAYEDEGTRGSYFSHPSPIIAANSDQKHSLYSTSNTRHGREVEETTYNRMTEMPNIARASTPELNYYERDDLYFHELENPNYVLSHSEPWVQNPPPNTQDDDGSPERTIPQHSSSKISKGSPVFYMRSHSPGVFRTSDYMSHKALDPPSQPMVGKPLGGKAPSQTVALDSQSSIKYQFDRSHIDMGRVVSTGTADTFESIHDNPRARNEEGDALPNPPEGGPSVSHPGLKGSGGKALSLSRWGLRKKNGRDAPVSNGERKIGFRQRIRNMFHHSVHV